MQPRLDGTFADAQMLGQFVVAPVFAVFHTSGSPRRASPAAPWRRAPTGGVLRPAASTQRVPFASPSEQLFVRVVHNDRSTSACAPPDGGRAKRLADRQAVQPGRQLGDIGQRRALRNGPPTPLPATRRRPPAGSPSRAPMDGAQPTIVLGQGGLPVDFQHGVGSLRLTARAGLRHGQ